MALYKIKVCAVGNEAEMLRMHRVLLENGGAFHEPDDRPPYNLKELYDQVIDYAGREMKPGATFVYQTIAPRVFGRADEGSYFMQRLDGSLYIAMFSYESSSPFQQQDWLAFHQECNELPLFVLSACSDFERERGEAYFYKGRMSESWSRMNEVWFYLFEDYAAGLVDEDAVEKLKQMEPQIIQSGDSIDDLLQRCADNLIRIGESVHVSGDELEQCIAAEDDEQAFILRAKEANAALWDIGRNAKRLACLEYVTDAWKRKDELTSFF